MDVNDQQDSSPPDVSTNHPKDAVSDDTIDEMQQTKKSKKILIQINNALSCD